jgi:hypothetical protein
MVQCIALGVQQPRDTALSYNAMSENWKVNNAIIWNSHSGGMWAVQIGSGCSTVWCSASRWVCNNQEALLSAIQIELAVVAIALLAALVWTVGRAFVVLTCQPEVDENEASYPPLTGFRGSSLSSGRV